MADGDGHDGTPRRPRSQRLAVALVCLLCGLLGGFVVVAVAVVGDSPEARSDAEGSEDTLAPARWSRTTTSSGRFALELPGEPIDDTGTIVLGADRSVPVATRHVTTSDGVTATVAELDYSAVLGDDEYDLRLGAAGAVVRAGGSMRRFEEVASPLGRAASFSGSGDEVEVRGFLVADGGQVVLLLVTAPPSGVDAAGAAILRMAVSLSPA